MTVATDTKTRTATRPKTSAETDGKIRPRKRNANTPGRGRSARRQDYAGNAKPGDKPRTRRLTVAEDTRENWAKVFDEWMTIMDYSLGEVAACLGYTEQAINDRRNGKWPNIPLKELERMAEIGGFPVELFLKPPAEMIRWCLTNNPDIWESTPSPWNALSGSDFAFAAAA